MTDTRKRIYIAYTGGTIGMKPSNKGYVPAAHFLTETLLNTPEFHRDEMPAFDIHEYHPLIDSSDMAPEQWLQIGLDIKNNYHSYDGFVILHGTDTMAYTASALSFMFDNLAKPVIVTGSQIPLAELRSDGKSNLLNALYIAANYPIHEVTLFFNNQLYRGNRTTKIHSDGFDAFGSPNFNPLLTAGIDIEVDPSLIKPCRNSNLQLNQISEQPVGITLLYPGISEQVIDNMLQLPVKALIIKSYGVGNAPQNASLLAKLAEANERGVIVVNSSQCLKGTVNMEGYATGKALSDAGLISAGDMTTEAALTKLHLLLSKKHSATKIKQLFTTNLKGELSSNH